MPGSFCKGEWHQFSQDLSRRALWIAAVKQENWTPTEYTWICSKHFTSGKKSNNPLSLNYGPTLFNHTKSPIERKKAGIEKAESLS